MRRIILLAILLAWCILASAQDVRSFVERQLETYPQSRLLDIYKSCFQDYMGAEHLVSDRTRVKAYLDEELKSTTLEELMPWYYEPCGVNGQYIRVSIRAIKENLINEETLLDAFMRSANKPTRPTVESWKERWHAIMDTIGQMKLELQHEAQDMQYIDSILTAGHYAISHSPEYRNAYRPHYRIVEKSIFEGEIKPLLDQKTMIVRIAEIEVHRQYLADYLKASQNVGAESVLKEPGVICIFPNQLKEDETKFRIVEIYRNLAAYEHHLTTEHFQAYKQGTLHMVKSLKLVDLSPLDVAGMNQIFLKMK